MEYTLGKKTKTFTQILSEHHKRVAVENITCKALFGPEYYKGKRILNLQVDKNNIKSIRQIESNAGELFSELFIQSSCRGGLVRTYYKPATIILDPLHDCRTFAEIVPGEELMVTLEYQGFWSRNDAHGHFWNLKQMCFIPSFD